MRHALAHNGEAPTGADYASVRTGAFMGKTILGVAPERYLVDISPSTLMALDARAAAAGDGGSSDGARSHLPLRVRGGAFAAEHGAHGDSVTRVEASASYAVAKPAAHPIYEHFRVRLFRQLLEAKASTEQVSCFY